MENTDLQNDSPSFLERFRQLDGLTKFASVFLVVSGIYYYPLEINRGFGPQHFLLMLAMIHVGVFLYGYISKALIIGSLYFMWQLVIVTYFNEGNIRWTTILFSFGLVYTYVGFYNLVYHQKIFTIDVFIGLLKFIMLAAFVVCLLQQVLSVAGVSSFPLINLVSEYTNKGPLACNSLFLEMSHFARFMLVCYYGYVKCCEIRRGKGTYTLFELFRPPHRWITLRFLWMMLTMESGTAMVGLLAFSLYFINKKNAIVLIPLFIFLYGLLEHIENKQLQRSLDALEATSTLDWQSVREVDSSAAARITPLLNSLHVDFREKETWFGHGVDYARDNELYITGRGTLFDDYGLILFILGCIFTFSCAYKINSLAALFSVMGIGGQLGGNIHYAWELAMIMTVVTYFAEQEQKNQNPPPVELSDCKNKNFRCGIGI